MLSPVLIPKEVFVYSPKVPDYLQKHTHIYTRRRVSEQKRPAFQESTGNEQQPFQQPFDTNYNAVRKIWWNNTREKKECLVQNDTVMSFGVCNNSQPSKVEGYCKNMQSLKGSSIYYYQLLKSIKNTPGKTPCYKFCQKSETQMHKVFKLSCFSSELKVTKLIELQKEL